MSHAVEMIDGERRHGRAGDQRGQVCTEDERSAPAYTAPGRAHVGQILAFPAGQPFIERDKADHRREGHLEAWIE